MGLVTSPLDSTGLLAGAGVGPGGHAAAAAARAAFRPLAAAQCSAKFGQISAICSSFSAVSAPIFVSKYAFLSIFQNLQDYLAEIFEIRQNFADFAT